MSKAVAALVINRNRYLIVKQTTGPRTGQWEFPGGAVDTGETEFEAVKRVVKENLGVDIFPYQTAATLISDSPSGETRLALIKCSISKDVKSVSSNHPSKYKWIHIFDTTGIAFAPLDNRIANLTKGKTIIPVKRRASGFASMSVEKRTTIARLGGKKAHEMGKAHRFTSEQARHAGAISRRQPGRNGNYDIRAASMRAQLLTLLRDSLQQRPGKPVSFVVLGKQLGISRQYVRTLYHQLKNDHQVPPVGKAAIQRTHLKEL